MVSKLSCQHRIAERIPRRDDTIRNSKGEGASSAIQLPPYIVYSNHDPAFFRISLGSLFHHCREQRVESPRALLKILHAGKGITSPGEELYPKLVY